ncbi:hypothetical protein [Halobacillus sp. Marseille-Q1614]|uniref:hypothetical protein n=1 Tax=Halobacillus sp. Marseille-Q1614 TaxID=2709134 RepID=UPI00156E85B5|nr:hypothetical protein [Halobacillus sp. Marseille-Q1614]
MDDFLPIKEDLALIRTEKMTFKQYNSIHSYPVYNVQSFFNAINKLTYERVLIGGEVNNSFYNEEEVNFNFESKKTFSLNKSKKYLELIFNKNDFIKEFDLINQIYLLTEINDFFFLVLNPIKGKKYYDVLSEKVSVEIDGEHERILWFEYDATDIYVAS